MENLQPAKSMLSPRELEVLELASSGLPNGHIARALGVTIHAVKFHLASIYRKLGVANRTEAAAAFLTGEALGPRAQTDATAKRPRELPLDAASG